MDGRPLFRHDNTDILFPAMKIKNSIYTQYREASYQCSVV